MFSLREFSDVNKAPHKGFPEVNEHLKFADS